jgi:NAD(P)-dependent dehydrogenase (short-subunit alcohol dehydrogenase family)
MSQDRKTAFVTGGRRGIGAAIVATFEAQGINVVAPTRQELDLADWDSVDKFVGQLERDNTRIDILVNNAGINVISPFAQISRDAWLSTLQVNLNAAFRLAQAFAPQMRQRAWGRIVNISSVFGLVTRENRAAYSAAKSALAGLTRTLAVELGPDNVLVNCVAPGYVQTELTAQNNSEEDLKRIASTIPLRRLAQPSEIARVVAFLCGEENTYITGHVLVADAGFTCL